MPASRKARSCPCGFRRLHGKAKKAGGVERCGSCYLRYFAGKPQLLKEPSHAMPPPRLPAAVIDRSPDPPAPFDYMPAASSGYATRSAASDASFDRAEGLENVPPAAAADSAMGDAPEQSLLALSNSPPSLLKLTTETVAAADPLAPGVIAGLAALRQEGVSTALRSALHMVGDPATPLSPQHKNRLAERFLHQRLIVDEHTAAAVLFESFSQSRIFLLRSFPGAVPPAFDTVAGVMRNPPNTEHSGYSFNHHGSRVHYVFSSLIDDSPKSRAAREWWRESTFCLTQASRMI